MLLTLFRNYQEKYTIGDLVHHDGLIVKTLELPWRDNERNMSCIPEGQYQVIKQLATKTRPYNFFRLMFVKDRSGILIHKITYVKDLKGCIGVGMSMTDLNRDGIPDMLRSSVALAEIWDYCPDSFTLLITKR